MILLVMCLLAVLGIALASYLEVSNNAMKLSNRAYARTVSRQLAEMGLEEALRAFNQNDWSGWSNSGTSATWTVSGTTATCNLTFPATKFGQGITGSVKIRIDNYNANQLDATWSNSANYRVNDLVGYSGTWYRCVQNNSNQTPNNWSDLTYWVPVPIPWTWDTNITYSLYDLVNYNGTWYRYINASSTNGNVPNVVNSTYWVSIPALSVSWLGGINYPFGSVVYYSGAWYYCFYRSGSASSTPTNTVYWAPMVTSTGADAVPGATTYAINDQFYYGDYVYRSTTGWLRCIVTTNPYYYASGDYSNSLKWVSSKPHVSLSYRSTAASYAFNDVVHYNGAWYRCKIATATSVPSTTTDWEYARSGSMFGWNSGGINYNLGDVVYYSSTGLWYRCIRAHTSTGSTTPDSVTSPYWSNAPQFSTAWNSSRQYSQNDTVRYNGVWYRSLQNSNTNQNPVTATTYWIGSNTATASYQWNASTAYSAGDYRCYGGVWYKCTTANTGQSPNNTTYWTASWANSFGITTGAPVIYTQSTVTLPDSSASIKTELRATIAPAPLFPNAAAATATINAPSGGTVDSYDSTTGTVALQPGVTGTAGTANLITGTYASQVGTSTNYSAVLAAGYTAGTAITLSSTAVKGYLAAPSSTSTPYAPLYSSGGSVKGFSSPATPNIDLTRISRSPYIPLFDTIPGGANGLATNWSSVPSGFALTLSATTTIGSPGATTPARYYYSGNLTIGGASIQYLKIIGPVILYVNGDLFITSSSSIGRIDINSTGSAEIHVSGVFKADVGGEGIQNFTGDPKSLIIICDTTSTSTHFYSEGVNDLYGVIYVPYSTSSTGYYNDNNSTEIFGAVTANKITYSGANLNIHYDTSLRYATFGGVDQPYSITEWRELTDSSEQVTLP